MNSSNWLESGFGEKVIGWAIMHSLWQITLVALGLSLILRYIPQRKAELRYILLLLGLSLATIWIGLTFSQLWISYENTITPVPLITLDSAPAADLAEEMALQPLSLLEKCKQLGRQLEVYTPIIANTWLIGIMLFSLYLFSGLVYLKYLQFYRITVPSSDWQTRFAGLCRQMGVKKRVELFISEKVDEPITFRFFRPVILVPISFFTGLTTYQIEVLLLHELAHIRRHDFAVNLLQSLVEVLFFYHPALWWISRRIRAEREHCCDDAVLAVQNQPILYAEALTQIQLHHFSLKKTLAMSATGKKSSFSKRVYRLFGQYDQQPSRYKSMLIVLLLIVISFSAEAFLVVKTPVEAPVITLEKPAITSVVTGKVYDENKAPLIGVNVLIKGTKTGTITDMQGKFRLELPDDCATLVFSYTGMEGKVLGNSCAGQNLAVVMEPERTLPKAEDVAAPSIPKVSKFEAFPNPSTGLVRISFNLEQAGAVKLRLYSTDGKLIKTLTDQNLQAGPQEVSWTAGSDQKGNFLLLLEVGVELFSKMLVVE